MSNNEVDLGDCGEGPTYFIPLDIKGDEDKQSAAINTVSYIKKNNRSDGWDAKQVEHEGEYGIRLEMPGGDSLLELFDNEVLPARSRPGSEYVVDYGTPELIDGGDLDEEERKRYETRIENLQRELNSKDDEIVAHQDEMERLYDELDSLKQRNQRLNEEGRKLVDKHEDLEERYEELKEEYEELEDEYRDLKEDARKKENGSKLTELKRRFRKLTEEYHSLASQAEDRPLKIDEHLDKNTESLEYLKKELEPDEAIEVWSNTPNQYVDERTEFEKFEIDEMINCSLSEYLKDFHNYQDDIVEEVLEEEIDWKGNQSEIERLRDDIESIEELVGNSSVFDEDDFDEQLETINYNLEQVRTKREKKKFEEVAEIRSEYDEKRGIVKENLENSSQRVEIGIIERENGHSIEFPSEETFVGGLIAHKLEERFDERIVDYEKGRRENLTYLKVEDRNLEALEEDVISSTAPPNPTSQLNLTLDISQRIKHFTGGSEFLERLEDSEELPESLPRQIETEMEEKGRSDPLKFTIEHYDRIYPKLDNLDPEKNQVVRKVAKEVR